MRVLDVDLTIKYSTLFRNLDVMELTPLILIPHSNVLNTLKMKRIKQIENDNCLKPQNE